MMKILFGKCGSEMIGRKRGWWTGWGPGQIELRGSRPVFPQLSDSGPG